MAFGDSMETIFIYSLCLPFLPLYAIVELCTLIPFLFKLSFPLSEIPGPRFASWTRFSWIKTLYHNKTSDELVRLNKKYGPIVRISPNSITISDPEITRRVLEAEPKYKRGPWFDSLRLDPYTTTVVSERDPRKHQRMRSILSAGLSGNHVDMEATIDKCVRKWIGILDNKYTSTNDREVNLNLSQSLPLLTLDIMTDLCLGESFRCLEKGSEQYDFLEALQTGMVAQHYISVLPELKNLLFFVGRIPFIRSRIFPNTKDKTGIGRVMQVCLQSWVVVTEKQLLKWIRLFTKLSSEGSMEPAKRLDLYGDILGSFLSRGLTLEQASSELVVVLSSGVEPTSYAVQGIIRCIVAEAQVCRKLQNEIDHHVVEENARQQNGMRDSALCQMTYLQACITEGLRIHPPIFQLREREVPLPGDILFGYRVPGGTFVSFNTLATQQHPIYGDHQEEFHPERWLINDEALLKQMYCNLELVFGYGASKCLGINIAHMKLNKIIFEVFRNYNISFANPESPWKNSSDFLLSDFQVKIERREAPIQINGFHTP